MPTAYAGRLAGSDIGCTESDTVLEFAAVALSPVPNLRGRTVKNSRLTLPPIAVALSLAGCHSGAAVDNDWALKAASIEAAVDAGGRFAEIEYHISPDEVPVQVRDAMMQLRPGGTLTAAEYEINGGREYYELTTQVMGRDTEAMFRPDGTLHSLEVEIDPQSAPAITKSVAATWPGSRLKSVEEIRNDAQELVEYHVKIDAGGKSLKVMVGPDGMVKSAVRETVAELEVPMPIPIR